MSHHLATRELLPQAAEPGPARMVGLGTAQPPFILSQTEALERGLSLLIWSDEARDLFVRLMRADGVERRHLGVERAIDLLETSHEKKLERFERWGTALSAAALADALAGAGIEPAALDYLAITSCTGYLCPGLSAYVAEASGLRPDVRRVDIVGMGCGAALPALEQATHFLAAYPAATAAVVCTEICSAAMLLSEAPDQMVSNAIFGDGSAAVVLRRVPNGAGRPAGHPPTSIPRPVASRAPSTGAPASSVGSGRPALLPSFVAFRSLLEPKWRDSLRFRTEGGHLRNVLAREVPVLAAHACQTLADELLAEQNLSADDIDRWVIHAGGKAVIDAVSRRLRLRPEQVASARTVLRTSGNMSSPTVLFVLAEEHRARPPVPGERALMTSFGAGFAAHAAILEY